MTDMVPLRHFEHPHEFSARFYRLYPTLNALQWKNFFVLSIQSLYFTCSWRAWCHWREKPCMDMKFRTNVYTTHSLSCEDLHRITDHKRAPESIKFLLVYPEFIQCSVLVDSLSSMHGSAKYYDNHHIILSELGLHWWGHYAWDQDQFKVKCL